jgi:hypothetical protein
VSSVMIDNISGAINNRAATFIGGGSGTFCVQSQKTILGEPISSVPFVDAIPGFPTAASKDALWVLCGVTSNDRYTTRMEKTALSSLQASIGRPQATCSALILLRKTADWWGLTQDERREILEDRSHHIAIGMRYLPAVARRLLHCRDLGAEAPFDFLGYLDYAPEDAAKFDDMIGELRASDEWRFIDREIDIRLTKRHG